MKLLNDEQILWSGKPVQGIKFIFNDLFMIPFSILWCGFAIFWTVNAMALANAPILFPIIGILFICAGLFFVFGRFIQDSINRSGIEYHLTTKRVIIIKFGKEEFIPMGQWSCLKLEKYSDKVGTIKFSEISMFSGNNLALLMPSFDKNTQFYRITDPDLVMSKIMEYLESKK